MELWDSVTLERVLYLAIFVAGVSLRLYGLALRPLSPLEAWNALAAWQAATGLPGPSHLTPTSPLWHSLQVLVFWLGGDGDAWARAVSAVAGALLVLVPWGLRGLAGRPTALVLSALIALDPWLVAFSRLADGAMLSAALAMALLAGAVSLLAGRRSWRMEAMLAVAAGLFVASGHMAWSFAPVLLAFALLNWYAIRQAAVPNRNMAGWFAISAVAGATVWLTQIDGLGMISASLTMWIDSVLRAGVPAPLADSAGVLGGPQPLGWPMTRLLADQALLAVFGVGGLIHMLVSRREGAPPIAARWPLFLWLWLGWGVLLCLLPGRSPFSLLVAGLPLVIGAAHALNELIAAPKGGSPLGAPLGAARDVNSQGTPAVFVTLAVLVISGAFWGIALISEAAFDATMAQAVAVIFVLGLAILVLYGAWSGVRQAIWVGAVAAGVILSLGSVSSTWQLNQRYSPERRDALFAEAGGEGARQLVSDVNTISAQRAGDPHEITVFIEAHMPSADPRQGAGALWARVQAEGRREPSGRGWEEDVLLGWYLRHMRRLTWGAPSGASAEVDAPTPAPLVISAQDASSDGSPWGAALAEEYIGSDYVFRTIWLPSNLNAGSVTLDATVGGLSGWLSSTWASRIQPRLRWVFYRRGGGGPLGAETKRVILWVQRDQSP